MNTHPENEQVKLLVANLSRSTSETEIRALFQDFGDVGEVRLSRNGATGRFRGDAFVLIKCREVSAELIIPCDLVLGGNRLSIVASKMGTPDAIAYKREPRRFQRQLY